MNKTPQISVVLPVFNGMKYLKESVDSVINQDIDNYEFLICDDCSTDGSYDFLSNYDKINFQLYKNKTNKGLFPTLNFLIKKTKASLIHLWAQDDIMYSNCLSETLKFHKKFSNINFSFSRMNIVDETGKIVRRLFEIEDKTISPYGHAKSSILYGSISGNIANVTVVKSAVEKVGYFNEKMKYVGDFDMWCKLSKDTPVGMLAGYLIKLRQHPEQLSRNLDASYYKLAESLQVYNCFLTHFKNKKLKIAQRALKWKIYPQFYSQLLLIKKQKKKLLENKYKNKLKEYDGIFYLFLRWFIVRIFRVLKIENKFYQKYIISKL